MSHVYVCCELSSGWFDKTAMPPPVSCDSDVNIDLSRDLARYGSTMFENDKAV